jgi:hypothetical protein
MQTKYQFILTEVKVSLRLVSNIKKQLELEIRIRKIY